MGPLPHASALSRHPARIPRRLPHYLPHTHPRDIPYDLPNYFPYTLPHDVPHDLPHGLPRRYGRLRDIETVQFSLANRAPLAEPAAQPAPPAALPGTPLALFDPPGASGAAAGASGPRTSVVSALFPGAFDLEREYTRSVHYTARVAGALLDYERGRRAALAAALFLSQHKGGLSAELR